MKWRKWVPAAYGRHGVKTGLACLLAYEVSLALSLPYAFWAVISTVIVMQVYVADSVKMCLYRFFGTAMGAVIGIFAIWAFPQGRVANDAAIVLTLGFCAFMTRYSPRFRMAAITVSVVAVGSFGDPMEERVLFALWRVVEITVGVGSAFLVSVFLFPERLEKDLSERLKSQRKEAAGLCRDLTQVFVRGDIPVPSKRLASFAGRVHGNRQSLSGITHHELLFSRGEKGETLAMRIFRMERICAHLQVMAHALSCEALLKENFYMESDLVELSLACAVWLEAPYGEEGEKGRAAIDAALFKGRSTLSNLRSKGATFRFDLEVLAGFYEFWSALKSLAMECSGKPSF